MVLDKVTLLVLLAEIRRHASGIREEEWTNTNEGVGSNVRGTPTRLCA